MDRTTHATLRTLALALVAWSVAGVPPASSADADRPPANPAGGGGTVILEPVAAPPVQRKHRKVFVCAEDGAPVYSDRPCGPIVAIRELDVSEPGPGSGSESESGSGSGQASSTLRAEPTATTRPLVQHVALESPRHERDENDRCNELHQQLDAVDEQMRAGYSARQAARLWNRWRDLKARIHASRC